MVFCLFIYRNSQLKSRINILNHQSIVGMAYLALEPVQFHLNVSNSTQLTLKPLFNFIVCRCTFPICSFYILWQIHMSQCLYCLYVSVCVCSPTSILKFSIITGTNWLIVLLYAIKEDRSWSKFINVKGRERERARMNDNRNSVNKTNKWKLNKLFSHTQ